MFPFSKLQNRTSLLDSYATVASTTHPHSTLTIRSHRRHGALAQRLPLGDALRARQRLATVALELAHQHRLRAAGRRLAGDKLAQGAAGQHGSSGAAQLRGAHDQSGQHHIDGVIGGAAKNYVKTTLVFVFAQLWGAKVRTSDWQDLCVCAYLPWSIKLLNTIQ